MANFDTRINNLPPRIYNILSEIDNSNGKWIGGVNLSPQLLQRLKKSTLITSTGASTRIEGSKLSDNEIESLIKGIGVNKFSDRDSSEVGGYFELLNLIFKEFKSIIFSENIILQFHSELLKFSSKDQAHKGKYKFLENSVDMKDENGNLIKVLFQTTPAFLVKKEMTELIDWVNFSLENSKYHPLLIISNFIVEFLKIHPFLDGNGRMSRLLTNFLLLKSNYLFISYTSHEKIIEELKSEYYISLRKSQNTLSTENENILDWTEFFLNVIKIQSEEALKLITKESVNKLLSSNQLIILEVFENSENDLSIKEILNITHILRPTIKQSLNKLVELKLIERIGLGRTSRYRKLV